MVQCIACVAASDTLWPQTDMDVMVSEKNYWMCCKINGFYFCFRLLMNVVLTMAVVLKTVTI